MQHKAFGIVNSCGRNIWVDGMQNYRPIGSFSFLGRYRVVDFPISNLTNSDIDRIQVYIDRKPRSLVEHLSSGRPYGINSKSGMLQLLFPDHTQQNNFYNTDVAAYLENIESLEKMHHPFVVIVPSYMVYRMDFSSLIDIHVDSGADITLLYHTVDNAKVANLNLNILNLNRQKGLLSIEPNYGNANNRNIFMDTYVMRKELFMELINKARKISSMFSLSNVINHECSELDIRGVAHHGFFASITDFKGYYDANMSLIDYESTRALFREDWPFYTRSNDSCPTQYFPSATVKNSVISNGCQIEGSLENSIVGRGCKIKKGAVIKDSIILSDTIIGENVHIENYVVDKHTRVENIKELIGKGPVPGYVRRRDRI